MRRRLRNCKGSSLYRRRRGRGTLQSIDADQSGGTSPREIIGALSFMCYGEVNTKISTIFEFFDEDGSRGMSRSEMLYLRACST